MLLQKSKQNEFNYVEVNNIYKWFSKVESKEIKVESTVLGSLPWALVADEDEMNLINKIYKNSTALGNEAEIFNGIQTSAERPPIYWFSAKEVIEEKETYFRISKLNKDYTIEKDITKKIF